MIAIVDCNNFFASCERVFNPRLNGKPVVVLSNNDGCIVARSNEAKALGIPMGAPYFQWKSVVLQYGVYVFSSNFALYGDMSRRVMDVVGNFLPEECLRVYSVDEAFLNLDCVISPNLPQEARQEKILAFAHHIRQTVKQWTGIPVSIGIAPTKTLAKIANRIAKKTPSANGVFACANDHDINEALRVTGIGDVWGVGRRLSETYRAHSITTALDLKNAPEEWVRKRASILGWRTQQELKGIPCVRLESLHEHQQSILHSRSFRHPITTVEVLQEAVSTFAEAASEKLRRLALVCGCVSVSVRTNRFSKNDYYSNGGEAILPFVTDSAIDIVRAALKIVEKIALEGHEYKKASVTLLDLSKRQTVQTDLFSQIDTQHENIMQAMDALNKRFGRDAVHLASGGAHSKTNSTGSRSWQGANDIRSQRYTTHWRELRVVEAR